MIIKSQRITIKQVAKLAGVSYQTVSRVINDKGEVSPETRKRIQDIIDQYGYKPSAVARSLSQKRSYTLGVVTAGLKYIGPSMILNGMTDEADELGYALILKKLPKFHTNNVQPIFEALLAQHVDGIIWAVPQVGENQKWLEEQTSPLPVPFMFLTASLRSDLSSVDHDNYLGGKMATEHLLLQGYRKIGHISGPLDWLSARQRKKGWEDALQEAGIDPEEMPCVEGDWSSASGVPAFTHLLSDDPEVEAVFVANDQMALSVLQLACKKGIKIPDDLGVVGFDGIAESEYFWPPLTTVSQDLHALGATAVKEIVNIIELLYEGEEKIEAKQIILPPKLIIRESSRKKIDH
ncbi:MAG: LacI family transcriptional regulator [Chloroflexi bacterium]|nr:MAG: LacI family transcriptional regulator [Chloroflexota bacterium]